MKSVKRMNIDGRMWGVPGGLNIEGGDRNPITEVDGHPVTL